MGGGLYRHGTWDHLHRWLDLLDKQKEWQVCETVADPNQVTIILSWQNIPPHAQLQDQPP